MVLTLIMAMRPPGASGEYIDGKPVFDYCRCIDQKPFDRGLAVNVINRNLHRSPGSPEEKKDVSPPPAPAPRPPHSIPGK